MKSPGQTAFYKLHGTGIIGGERSDSSQCYKIVGNVTSLEKGAETSKCSIFKISGTAFFSAPDTKEWVC